MKVALVKEMKLINSLGADALEYILEDIIFEGDYEDTTYYRDLPAKAKIAVLYELNRQFSEAITEELEHIKKEA